jgi:hypothetical protein
MKMGSPMILTCMNRILQKTRKNMRLNTFTAMKEILILEMKQSFMVSIQIREKGVFVAGFAANSISDAAQVLINISIKNRIK